MGYDALDAFAAGLDSLWSYVAAHVLFCLIPAFFIAGAIAALLKKEAVLRYFGANVKPWISYSVASISGTVLAVCSCTILPLFAGIYRKGAGLGPAATFLYAGPAINILAIVYTARLLGVELGIARAVAAILLSVVIGVAMAWVFRAEEGAKTGSAQGGGLPTNNVGIEGERPGWAVLLVFVFLIAILVLGTTALPLWLRLAVIYVLSIGIFLLIVWYFTRDEVAEWGFETWDLAKKIVPVLLAGAFLVGVIAYFVPPANFRPYIGGNSLPSCFVAAVLGAFLYMPTLLEVPIVGTTLGYSSGVMGGGPALALLLSGPATSLPSMLVLYRLIGAKKTVVFVLLTIITATFAGFIYGMMVG